MAFAAGRRAGCGNDARPVEEVGRLAGEGWVAHHAATLEQRVGCAHAGDGLDEGGVGECARGTDEETRQPDAAELRMYDDPADGAEVAIHEGGELSAVWRRESQHALAGGAAEGWIGEDGDRDDAPVARRHIGHEADRPDAGETGRAAGGVVESLELAIVASAAGYEVERAGEEGEGAGWGGHWYFSDLGGRVGLAAPAAHFVRRPPRLETG